MQLRNVITGDTLDVPPPDNLGACTIALNGVEVMRALFSDADGSVTLGDGRKFGAGKEFADFLVSLVEPSAGRSPVRHSQRGLL